jgi:phosphoribosylformylglycinamidine cyclo-ligase
MTGVDGLSYRSAGVDRDTAERTKDHITRLVRSTLGPDVLSRPGAFGGQFRIPKDFANGVLVASADGVGTKLKVAMLAGRHDTVGQDLVNHCVDDILVEGARPLFFLDYIGMGQLEEDVVAQLVEGMSIACRDNACALLGGETAEMPDFYAPGEYDLAGFIVGVVEENERPGMDRVREGDVLIAIASNGFHTNGYSLLRKVLFEHLDLGIEDRYPGTQETVGDVLLRVHRSYRAAVAPLLSENRVHALAHITGGGIPGNLSRVIPEGLEARVERSSWQVPVEFASIMKHGGVAEEEMFHTFNMGVGMFLVVAPGDVQAIVSALRQNGENAWEAGTIASGDGAVRLI